ncbi:conserved repeat domain-containing protein/gliding motility-associated C-terminal domain-containing protein [Chitinophaga sp. YR573]|uniref:T9SS type B sorting domain-containing protein n=1 Tax=Chitinophaga sp. YR573 TaxID=1881040 RepID=UPI0008CBEDEF|nr:gliding motility-associated C-terminal domain-containing protein [Chitinophaga sp. YR573]SEW25562.1 conserved repeat domain-containing protein/gliding motility-associated C-terminal domain-containing protein [Chitinophaga sp. YR573]
MRTISYNSTRLTLLNFMQRREALVHGTKTLILLLLAGLSWQPAAANAATRTRGGTSPASVKANRPLNFAYTAWTTTNYSGSGYGGAVIANDQIAYTVHVHNTGTDPITALTIMSNIPAYTSLYGATAGYILSGSQITYTPALPLAAGAYATFTFTVTVNSGSLAAIGYINDNSYVDFSDGNGYQTAAFYEGGPIPTATEYGTQVPVDNGMNAVAWKTQVYSPSGAGGYIGSGDVIHYVIWVRNMGTAALANISITDNIPSYTNWRYTSNGTGAAPVGGVVTMTIPSLAPGAQDTVSFDVTVAQDLTGATAIENTATVDINNNKSAFNTVPVDATGNNPSTIPTIGPSTSIPVKSVTSFETWKLWLNDNDNTERTASPGEDVTFYVYVHNTGNVAITTLTINDLVPPGTTFKSIKDGGAYNAGANSVTWIIDNVAAGAKSVSRFTVTMDAHLEGVRSITNTAVVKTADTTLFTIGCDPSLSTCDGKVGTVVTVTPGSKDLFVSTVVTPNGDGKNDFFYVRGIEKYPNSALHIFNRWGNTVYQSKSYENNWSATGLSEGTYYYQLDLNQSGTIKTYKGWVMIIR